MAPNNFRKFLTTVSGKCNVVRRIGLSAPRRKSKTSAYGDVFRFRLDSQIHAIVWATREKKTKKNVAGPYERHRRDDDDDNAYECRNTVLLDTHGPLDFLPSRTPCQSFDIKRKRLC